MKRLLVFRRRKTNDTSPAPQGNATARTSDSLGGLEPSGSAPSHQNSASPRPVVEITALGPQAPDCFPAAAPPHQATPVSELLARLPWGPLDSLTSREPSNTVNISQDICKVCQTIPFNWLPSEHGPALPHHNWADLNASASNCQLCRIILWAVREHKKRIIKDLGPDPLSREYIWGGKYISGPVPEIYPITQVWLYASWWNKVPGAALDLLMGLGVRLGVGEGSKGLLADEADGREKKRVRIRGTDVRICTDFGMCFATTHALYCSISSGDALGTIVPGRLREMDPGSDKVFGLISRWLSVCDYHHDCMPVGTRLPPRVLDLTVLDVTSYNESDNTKVLETNGRYGAYIALSHCWGQSQHIKTLKSNVEEFKQCIEFNNLPKTFQDAIRITRRLGIPYLWIDSLCIIQDSSSDWQYQASLMGSIYAHAYLTIAASASNGDDTGCFAPHPAIYVSPDEEYTSVRDTRPEAVATATVNLANGKTSKLYFFPEWKRAEASYKISQPFDPVRFDPLCSRAWTLQERILSPRTLHYGVDQTYWECQEMLLAEDGARFDPVTLNPQSIAASDQDEKRRLRDGWPKLVTAYSKRNLTRGTDKLPALSGLASEIAMYTGDTYYAGVWKSHLWSDLFWRVIWEVEWLKVGCFYKEDMDAYLNASRNSSTNVDDTSQQKNVEKSDPRLLSLEEWRSVVTPSCPPLAEVEIPKLRSLRFDVEDKKFRNSNTDELNDVGRPEAYRAPSWSFASLDAPVVFNRLDAEIIAICEDIYVDLAGTAEFGAINGGWIRIKACHYFQIKSNLLSFILLRRSLGCTGLASRLVALFHHFLFHSCSQCPANNTTRLTLSTYSRRPSSSSQRHYWEKKRPSGEPACVQSYQAYTPSAAGLRHSSILNQYFLAGLS